MAEELKLLFSVNSAQRLRIDIDGEPYAIRSMREFRLKEQVAFKRECQSVAQSWGELFKPDAAPTEEEIDYVTEAIDAVIKRIVVDEPEPFLALTEMQKLDVIGAFAGNVKGGSGGPPSDSSPASVASTESIPSA